MQEFHSKEDSDLMKKIIFPILLLFIVFNLFAQEQSILKNIALSAVIPGLGELKTNNYTKTGIFFTTEIGIWFSYFRFKEEMKWSENSYQQFAFSKTQIPVNSSDDYYQNLQDYRSSDVYNENVELYARNVFLLYYNDPDGYEEFLNNNLIPDNEAWDWETDKNWNKYKQLRRKKQDYEIYTKFAFASIILNRVISVIDTAFSTKKYNKKILQNSSLNFTPNFQKKGLQVVYEYKFY